MLIGITGAARSGKDTVANYLFVEGFAKESFAGPIREMICRLTGMTLEQLEKYKEISHPALQGKSPRYAMQTLGTEWGRNLIGDSLWVDACLARAFRHKDCVISDVRFDNEALAVRKAGGTVLKIVRPNLEAISLSNHKSEQGVSSSLISATIINDGTISDLEEAAYTLVNPTHRRR